MSDFDAAVAGLRAMRPPYRNSRIKVTGFLDPATGLVGNDPTSGAQPGYMWVHGYPRGGNVQVIAGTAVNPYYANVRVYVGENDARQAVAYAPVIDRSALEQFGSVFAALMQPSGADELLARSIAGLGFVPGRVEPSQLLGLNIHIRDFWYDSGFYNGDLVDPATGLPTANDFSIASDLTVTTGMSQWVIISFDPIAGVPRVTVNTPQFGDARALYTYTTPDISGIPVGDYVLGAVAVEYGQTLIDSTSVIADLRFHLAAKTVPLGDIVVDADGDVVTSADGYVVVTA